MIVLNQRVRNNLRCLKYWLYTKTCFACSLKTRKYLMRLENWLYIKNRQSLSAGNLMRKLKGKLIVPLTIEQRRAIDTLWKGKKYDYGWFEFYNTLAVSSTEGASYHIEWYIPDNFYYSVIDPYFNQVKEGKIINQTVLGY